MDQSKSSNSNTNPQPNNQRNTLSPQNQPLISPVPSEMKYPIIPLSIKVRWFIFVLLTAVTFFSYLDGGIIPAKTTDIKNDLHIDNANFGLFGSVEYIGRLIGSVVFTITINKINRKYLLIGALLFKGLLLISFYFIQSFTILCVFRGLGGISQVFFMIYIPVWCDQYGQRKARTMMITISQLFLPLGIALGYGLATFIGSWVFAFIIEGGLLLALALIILFIPIIYFSNTLVLLKNSDNEGREILQGATDFEVSFDRSRDHSLSYNRESITKIKKSLWNNLCYMFKEMIFIFTGLSNSVISFVLSVIQYWAPEYMEKTLLIADENTRFYMFAVICITSPIFGMTFSGVLGSYIGGYKNKNSIYLCLIISIIGPILGVVVSEMTEVWPCIIVLWVFCFCSYARHPIEVGIIITSLPHHMRGDGYSVVNFFVNLIGNLPSSYVYGLLYDYYKDTSSSNMAFKIVMYFNFAGIACLLVTTFFRVRMPVDLDASHIYPELPDDADKEDENKTRRSYNN